VTARRLRNLIKEAFCPRYLVDDAAPARLLKRLSTIVPRDEFRSLCFLFTCRANLILGDFVRQVYWPHYSAGRSSVSRDDSLEFVSTAVSAGRTTTRWSEATVIDQTAGLLSWAVGVAFGRFDWQLATGERAPPPKPEPFDPLPAQSPGMLPDGAEPFHRHTGVLVDDPGHPHDLAHLLEEVLARVDAPVPLDVRRWLQRDFFPFHLQRYGKSRRKAAIYWPLSTTLGSYTLWLYYPSLNSQTLYTAVNDFIEGPNGKQKQVELVHRFHETDLLWGIHLVFAGL
jgi:hypothetical protein